MKRRASWAAVFVAAAVIATAPPVGAVRRGAVKASAQLLISECTFTMTATWSTGPRLQVTHVNMVLIGTDRATGRAESNGQAARVDGNTASATWTTGASRMQNGFDGAVALFSGDPAEGAQPIAQVGTKTTTARCDTPPPN